MDTDRILDSLVAILQTLESLADDRTPHDFIDFSGMAKELMTIVQELKAHEDQT